MHYALVAVSQQGYRAGPPTGMAIHGRRQQGMVGERERERKFERGGVAVIELCCQSYEGMWLVARKEGLAVRARVERGSERERQRERFGRGSAHRRCSERRQSASPNKSNPIIQIIPIRIRSQPSRYQEIVQKCLISFFRSCCGCEMVGIRRSSSGGSCCIAALLTTFFERPSSSGPYLDHPYSDHDQQSWDTANRTGRI